MTLDEAGRAIRPPELRQVCMQSARGLHYSAEQFATASRRHDEAAVVSC
jgi:hypothetical protein